MKILFTSVGRRVELVQMFKKASYRLNVNVVIYGADIDMTAPALFFCDKILQTPRIQSEEYIPFLLDFCVKNKIECLIPTIDTDLLILAENKNKFWEKGIRVVISDYEKIRICRDKRLTADYFKKVGLNTPIPVDKVEDYKGEYPVFIKPKDGSSSVNAYKVCDYQKLVQIAKDLPDYIIQPFIDGTEYTVDVFCDFDGNPIYITPRERLAVRAGEVLKTRISNDNNIIREIKQLIQDYRPCGPITIQLIKNETLNINWYIEINPRFGGGAPLSVAAGADSAEMLLRLLKNEKIGYVENAAEDGAVYSRFDQSVRVQ